MAGQNAFNPTILDFLNEDCWQAVLDYVPVRDIIRTERASCRWQSAMLAYLREVRIGIENHAFRVSDEFYNVRKIMKYYNIREDSFERWTHKLGKSVVTIYCATETMLEIVSKNCPNVEAFMFCDLHGKLVVKIQNKVFDRLRKLSIKRSDSTSDQCITEFIGSKAIEELSVVLNDNVTGQCLINIDPRKLKSITLHSCRSIQPHHLEIASQRWNDLTKLEIIDLPSNIYEHIPLLLNNSPKLEVLSIMEFEFDFVDFDNYYKSICKLSRLKKLCLHVQNITDADLEAVTRCCTELCSLDIKQSTFSDLDGARSLKTVCLNIGARLTTLGFTNFNNLTDDDILGLIRTCPKLTMLNVSSCWTLTPVLLAQIAAIRREMGLQKRLRIFVDETSIQRYYGMDFKELTIDRCICCHKI